MPLEKPDVFNALSVYREIGIKLLGLESFEKSLYFFDSALRRNPYDPRSLRARANSRAKANKYSDALKDVATLKEIDSDNIYVASYESLVKYLCSEFEQAFILNVTKLSYRKKPDNFLMGAMHCEDAIQNNIGPRAGHPLRDHFKIIRKLAWLKHFGRCKPYQPKAQYKKKRKESTDEKTSHQLAVPEEKMSIQAEHSKSMSGRKKSMSERKKSMGERRKSLGGEHRRSLIERTGSTVKSHTSLVGAASTVNTIFASKDVLFTEGSSIRESLNSSRNTEENIPPIASYPFKPIQNYTSNIRNLMAERYLDNMYRDKKFLEVLPTHPGIESPNKEGSRNIIKLAKKSSKYIFLSQEYLRSRRPFYFLRINDAKSCGKLEERRLLKEEAFKKCFELKSIKLIEKMKVAMSSKKLRQVVDAAEQIYDFCEKKSKKSLPNRDELLNEIYTSMRDAFYRIKCIESSLLIEQRKVRAAILLGLPNGKHELTYALITEYECPFENKKKKCSIFEDRIRKSTCRKQQIWFYHELTRLYYDRKEFEISRAYATKCLRESYIIGDYKWIVNTMFMIIKNDIAIKNNNGAKLGLKRCRRLGKLIGDQELDNTILLCLDLLGEVPVELNISSRIIERRIHKIKELITSDITKNESALIFQRISSSPPKRRMSVLPGIVYLNIKPAVRSDDNKDEKRTKAKSTYKDQKRTEGREKATGVTFLDLIQNTKEH